MKALDLFSAAGGLTLGLKRAGIEPVAAVEMNAAAARTYAQHTRCDHFVQDVREVDFSPYRNRIDLVYGGPPCQPWSTGGLRKGNSDSRDMIPAFIDVLRAVNPPFFLMENVPGLAVRSRLHYLERILAEFRLLGFEVSWGILNAADYGVPQKRKRLFVLGGREHRIRLPAPTHGDGTGCPRVATSAVIGLAPMGEAPTCPVKYARSPDLRRSPFAGHVYNGGGRPIDLAAPCHTILASAGGNKTHWVDTEDVAVEYHSHLMNGGAPREGVVPGARRLSVEESAAIQTFPPDLEFSGSRSATYKQVGDAVPPVLAAAIGRAFVAQTAQASGTVRLLDNGPEQQAFPLSE
tara:strand:- start:4384 stop:5430 length:1047 start_codon:yes stop_codon:yes gene_type:complete